MKLIDVLNRIRSVIVAIGKGDFILKWHLDKFLPQIMVLFVLSLGSMFLSYRAEQTMLKREENKTTIETLKIRRAQMASKLASMNRLTTIETKLKAMGSDLEAPQKPLTILD